MSKNPPALLSNSPRAIARHYESMYPFAFKKGFVPGLVDNDSSQDRQSGHATERRRPLTWDEIGDKYWKKQKNTKHGKGQQTEPTWKQSFTKTGREARLTPRRFMNTPAWATFPSYYFSSEEDHPEPPFIDQEYVMDDAMADHLFFLWENSHYDWTEDDQLDEMDFYLDYAGLSNDRNGCNCHYCRQDSLYDDDFDFCDDIYYYPEEQNPYSNYDLAEEAAEMQRMWEEIEAEELAERQYGNAISHQSNRVNNTHLHQPKKGVHRGKYNWGRWSQQKVWKAFSGKSQSHHRVKIGEMMEAPEQSGTNLLLEIYPEWFARSLLKAYAPRLTIWQ